MCLGSIFFPSSYDQTSPQTLPVLFSIHGGGFCFGESRDDDSWNRDFADKHNILVISLSYSLAPWATFPTPIYDIEAVVLAVLADESLPIDRSPRSERHGLSRTAIMGFSAGGNLALAVSQLESIRTHAQAPAAAVSVYGYLDLSMPPHEKLSNRPFKPELGPPRGTRSDGLMRFCPTFDWSYIPYGHDLCDPLLSPVYAAREYLPPFVACVAAELDMISHESWRLACRLAHEGVETQGGEIAGRGRPIPDPQSKDVGQRLCGQAAASEHKGALLKDERFSFEDSWAGGGAKWLLVPDVLHGFDSADLRNMIGGEEAVRDAEMKTVLYTDELGVWLRQRVWGL